HPGLRARQGERDAAGGDEGRHPGRRLRPAAGRGRPGGGGRAGAVDRPPLRQPALPAQAGRAADRARGLMAAVVSAGDRPRRPRRRKEARRWLREVRAILLLALAAFAGVALATLDPALAPGDQRGPVGPVGTLLGWALF